MSTLPKFLLGIFALAAIAISCDDDEEDYVIPAMSVDKTALSFDEAGGASAAQTVYVTSNRDWEATCDADWVFFSPSSAKASDNSVEVSVYVDANTGTDRSAKLTFDGATVSATVTVSQTGPSGESYGDGTVDNPYTVADALSIINAGSYTSKNVYVKGFISKIDEIDTGSYGNATYYISDDGTTDEQLEVYRGYSLGGAKFTSSDEIQVGDEVIVYGELTMYGTTPEVTQGSSIYYLNGVTADVGDVGDHELEGDGTVDNPYTATDALWLANDGSYTSDKVYVKGIISGTPEIDISYGNATYYISDDGTTTNRFEIYRGYSLGGVRFTSTDEIKAGDEVIVYGEITMYYTTPEMTTGSSIYSLNGVVSEVGGGDDDYDGEYVYHNNFDKSAATQTYGSGSSWPYLDQFDGWNNAEGSGISTVSYNYNNVSARNNSNSNGSYSNYSGSGTNNIFFGSTTNYFVIQDITLPSGTTDYTLSFGSEKYLSGGSSTFSHTEFHVYLSNDGNKWVELSYSFPNGDPDATWDRASTTFTLPSGTTSLYIYYTADVASAYRIDDVGLYASETSGTSIDFSTGVELPGGGEGTGGDEGGDHELVGDGTADNPYTAPDALWLANSGNYTDDEVYVTGIISQIDEISTSYGNATYYISDDGKTTEQFEIYRGYSLDGVKFTSESEIEVGDKVVVLGVITMYTSSYGSTPEMTTGSKIVSLEKGEGNTGGDEGGDEDEGELVYGNDFDKSVVSSNTTITSSVTAYQNETGSGASNVSYNWSSKMSVRVSNGSAGTYTNASGNNNIFFGAEDAGYFVIKNIALPSGEANYKLTFGAREDSNVFAAGTFKLYVSEDNISWVQLTYDFPDGSTKSGSWALASTTFTVPSGTSTLYIYYESDVQSVYRIDDMRLTVSSEAGTSIDFSTGVELEGGDSAGGGDEGEDIVDATAAEVNSGTDGTTYRVAGYITSVASTTYGNFYLKDYTGQTYIYGTLDANGNTKNWESLGISAGDIVKVHGPKSTYGSTAELVDVTVEEHYAVTDVTIAEFNAASVSTEVYYRLTGTVTSISSTTYGNLYIEDETGSVYVYGLPCGYGGSDKTFSETGVAQGDVITIVGTRGVYGSTIEVVNGFYVETVSSGSGGGDDSGDLPTFTSNVSWTLGDNASSDKATINGTSYDVLKLGTSSKTGNATFTIPAGSTSLAFYCFGWNGKTDVPYTVTIGSDEHSLTAQGNSGFNNYSPYTVTVSDASDYQTITFDSALTSETTVKVETTSSSNPRVVFAGINYYIEEPEGPGPHQATSRVILGSSH